MDYMNISAAKYIVNEDDSGAAIVDSPNIGIQAVIDGVTMSVPMDPANRHYKEILRQTKAKTLVIQEATVDENK